MRKFSKILSVLLAMVFVFSSFSIGAEAAYVAYKDSAITSYDAVDRPILTTEQYAAMAFDKVDQWLGEANLKINFDLAGLLTINADLTSIDAALTSVKDLWKEVEPMVSVIGGDVQNLNVEAALNAPLRTSEGYTDLDIIYALFQFLADNASVVAKVPKGSPENGGLDLGILSGFLDIGEFLNIPVLIKGLLAELVWPEVEDEDDFTEEQLSLTIDEYVETFVNRVATGDYPRDEFQFMDDVSDLILEYVPGIEQQIDFFGDSIYDIVEKAARIGINSVAIPVGNDVVRRLIREFCGVEYTRIGYDEDGNKIYAEDESNLNVYAKLFNIDLHLDQYDLSGWGDDSFVDHINEVLGFAIRGLVNPDIEFTWSNENGNADLITNCVNVVKAIINAVGEEIFGEKFEILDEATINSMSDQEFIAYAARSIINAFIDDVYLPDTCDTIIEVVFETMKSVAANIVPSRDYSDLEADAENTFCIILDMAAYGLNQVLNINLELGLTPDEFADAAMEWVIDKFGGFVSEVEGSGWEALSYVFFRIVPPNWLPYTEDGSERDNLYYILMDDLVANALELDVLAILDLFKRNPDSELNGTIIEVLLSRLASFFNYIVPNVFPEPGDHDYSTLEGLLDPEFLSSAIYNLITGFKKRVPALAASILPIFCLIVGASSPAEFDYPYISLPATLNPTFVDSFYMFNGSSGINTNATDKYGNTPIEPDQLYKYYIRSVETNQDGVTVYPDGDIFINGGTSQTFKLQGTPETDKVLKVMITYDVYEETGSQMTTEPLVATCYSYVSEETDDGEGKWKADADPKGNYHSIYYNNAVYFKTGSEVKDLEDIEFDLCRTAVEKNTVHSLPAYFFIDVDYVDVDPALADAGITVNPGGIRPEDDYDITDRTEGYLFGSGRKGAFEGFQPYIATDREALLEEGIYTNSFSFTATPTNNTEEIITFSQFICVYNDYGLERLVENAVSSDRQKLSYNMDEYEASYVDAYTRFELLEADPEYVFTKDDETQETVCGEDVWAEYEAALEEAVSIVYRPRFVNTFEETHASRYFDAYCNLMNAIEKLEDGSVSSGAAGVKAALEKFDPDDSIELRDENGDLVYYEDGSVVMVEAEYDDPRHTYFGREDYIGYTFGNFKDVKEEADDLIDDWYYGIAIESIAAAYIEHRLNLFGNRLIRIRAYTTHLESELAISAPIYEAGQGSFSAETWNEFTRAYAFAQKVVAEPIGDVIPGSENLEGDGLRQSKVNEARSQLIIARKNLAEGENGGEVILKVDYAQLNAAIANAKATYEAGNASDTYTALSWTTFESAYEAAVALVEQNLDLTDANQAKVNNAATTLGNAFENLEPVPVEEGGYTFDESTTIQVMTELLTENQYVVGLDPFWPVLTDYVYTTGGYSYEVTANDWGVESTGAVLCIYDNGALIEEIPLVFYGDINGDALLDGNDVSLSIVAASFTPEWTWGLTGDTAQGVAADINGDFTFDGNDVALMVVAAVDGFMDQVPVM